MKTKKERIKKADLDTKAGRYFLARKAGKTKKEAIEVAGYADVRQSYEIEHSKTYQAIEKKYYKDVLQTKISMEEIAEAHSENIRQSGDLGARNKAIEMALDRIEGNQKGSEDDERVMVILKG